ncbi:MAG: hypothetical protein C5B44_06565 [Acidobacteria bacterium]|nr:MAG: hypothetical protein C5B44_06565 [Acidobacteriota bacterium]
MTTRTFVGCVTVCLLAFFSCYAQQPTTVVEPPSPLTEPAFALNSQGQRVLEGTLRTTVLHGGPDTPVTNTAIILRNMTQTFYNYISGHATFYDASGVRCGDGLFKTDAFAPNEAAEIDTPGIRITCAPTTWRIVALDLLPRITPIELGTSVPPINLVISIDGEEHPLQLGKPLVLNLGDKKRAIVVRGAP